MTLTYPLAEALGIHRLPCPVPFVAAGGPANVYVIEEADGGVALFDSGIGTPPGEKAIREGFAGLGWRLGDVRRIYLSHGHVDHFGLARTISEESGAPVYIHEADRLKVERPLLEWRRHREAQDDYLRRQGVTEETLQALNVDQQHTYSLARPIEHTKPVHEGDVLRFRRFSARVMHAPGHTPGLTCLHVESHALLFSDDHLLERVSPNPLLDVGLGEGRKFRSLVSYMQTLERTRAMKIDLVLPGHNDPFRDVVPLIDRLKAFYEKRQERILSGMMDGPRTAVELVQHVFARQSRRDLFLTLSEIIGHLEVLEEKGAVVRDDSGPVHRWERVQ